MGDTPTSPDIRHSRIALATRFPLLSDQTSSPVAGHCACVVSAFQTQGSLILSTTSSDLVQMHREDC